jgi:uncharacterized protein YebE (UPF0316 family)
MSIAVALTFLLIVLARITDVTLDTLRTAAIIQGRRGFAAILGFFEALIYVVAIAKVLLNIDRPVYAFGYALGYALGTYFGITLEKRLAFGRQLAALVTRKGALLASGLEAAGYKVAVLSGRAGHEEVRDPLRGRRQEAGFRAPSRRREVGRIVLLRAQRRPIGGVRRSAEAA